MPATKAKKAALPAATASSAAKPKVKEVKTEVLGIRLSDSTTRWLTEVAEAQGLGASTLARMWILQRLSKEKPPSFAPDGIV